MDSINDKLKKFAAINTLHLNLFLGNKKGERLEYNNLISVVADEMISFAVPGDSGSLVVNAKNKAVGIVFVSSSPYISDEKGENRTQNIVLIPFYSIIKVTGLKLMSVPEPKKVFLSYSNDDLHYVNDLKIELKNLENLGLLIVRDIDPVYSENWDQKIDKIIDRSDLIVELFSQNYATSKKSFSQIIRSHKSGKNLKSILTIFIEDASKYAKSATKGFEAGNAKYIEKKAVPNVILEAIKEKET